MKLIVGLGNPDKKYLKTRHNLGFMALDLYASNNQLKFKYKADFSGFIAENIIAGEKVILLKPTTYMNLSGQSVLKVVSFYKIDIDDVLIVYDDVDVEFSKMRLRLSGSSGGHKGIKDIINQLKTDNIKRIKVGIGKEENLTEYVLGKFSKKERKLLEPVFDNIGKVIDLFISGQEFNLLMNEFN